MALESLWGPAKARHHLMETGVFVVMRVIGNVSMSLLFFRASFMTKTVPCGNELHKFLIWDTAGQERVRTHCCWLSGGNDAKQHWFLCIWQDLVTSDRNPASNELGTKVCSLGVRNWKGPNPIPANLMLSKLHDSIPFSLLADLEIDFF